MKPSERIIWALGILLLDFVIFFLPLASLFIAYILIQRPAWFKRFTERLYAG